ncbi:MAG TPA: hypothetical protein VLA56_15005, partial [Pseudomonadales bacterium]|nr:hypothetical protein [Pseudomonadales bacterium]
RGLMGFLLNMIGGKVGAGLVVALLAVAAWGWAQSERADTERANLETAIGQKALLAERLGQTAKLANDNAAAAAKARQDAIDREALVAGFRDTIDTLRADLDVRVAGLQEASDAAPVEYQACMPVPAPRSVQLLVCVSDACAASRGGDGDPDRLRDAAGGPAEAVPRA